MKRKTKIICTVKIKSKLVPKTVFADGAIVTIGYTGIVTVKVNKVEIKEFIHSLLSDDYTDAMYELDKIHNEYINKFN